MQWHSSAANTGRHLILAEVKTDTDTENPKGKRAKEQCQTMGKKYFI